MKIALYLMAAATLVAAELPSLDGTWVLNLQKSKYPSGMHKPVSSVIEIHHQEPKIAWDGTVTGSAEPHKYKFEGAIDGKEYTADQSYGPAKATLKRVNDRTFDSTIKSTDGKFTETARTSVSADGKTLTRTATLKSPDKTEKWTEVYERK